MTTVEKSASDDDVRLEELLPVVEVEVAVTLMIDICD
jgi:hypothetical protein